MFAIHCAFVTYKICLYLISTPYTWSYLVSVAVELAKLSSASMDSTPDFWQIWYYETRTCPILMKLFLLDLSRCEPFKKLGLTVSLVLFWNGYWQIIILATGYCNFLVFGLNWPKLHSIDSTWREEFKSREEGDFTKMGPAGGKSSIFLLSVHFSPLSTYRIAPMPQMPSMWWKLELAPQEHEINLWRLIS